jgi:hypothetical protein
MAAVTLPGTTVMARTSSSGELRASMRAMASSEPGSVSKIIFLAAEAGRAVIRIKVEMKSLRFLGICFLLSGCSEVG